MSKRIDLRNNHRLMCFLWGFIVAGSFHFAVAEYRDRDWLNLVIDVLVLVFALYVAGKLVRGGSDDA